MKLNMIGRKNKVQQIEDKKLEKKNFEHKENEQIVPEFRKMWIQGLF